MPQFSEAGRLLDELIHHWPYWDRYENFYLKELAPALVKNPNQGTEHEIELFGKLQNLLTCAELDALPELISERRAGRLREIDSERLRREDEEQSKQEEEHRKSLSRDEERKKEQLRLEVEKRRLDLLAVVRKLFSDDFLRADSFFKASCSGFIPNDEYEKEKAIFVQDWVKKETGTKLDMEQASAVGSVHGNTKVIARAGSGKTTTIVNRALFLQKHCGVPPDEMLLLAFNRKAADEMAKRLGNGLPHVMTFHAFAYAIVHPEESILVNGPPGESQGLSRAIQQVIDDHVQIPEFKAQIRELMLGHFREDWDRIVEGHYDRSKEDLLQYRRSLTRESLRGEYLKSFGEKIIADFLFEHDIPYRYERNHWWNGVNYRPDFTLFKNQQSGVVIEYFGMEGDTDYDAMSQEKRKYWSQKHNWTLLEFSPKDITRGCIDIFRTSIKAALEGMGFQCNRLSEDEIWNRVRGRAIDRFTKVSAGFIGRCRQLRLSPDDLTKRIECHAPLSPVEGMFLKVMRKLYAAYLDRLVATGEDDFNGLMQRAIDMVASGVTIFERKTGRGDINNIRFAFVDEFQDFSQLFYSLVDSIRRQNPRIEYFCVGDDWQAINGFAGSDLKFFDNFGDYFDQSRSLNISTNYRSSESIVDIGNVLMDRLGKPAISYKTSVGQVLLVDLAEFEPSLLEKQQHPGDIITLVVSRLTAKALADGYDVVFLCRRNGMPWFVDYPHKKAATSQELDRYLDRIRSLFSKSLRDRITISTAHKYKGLEKDMVIVLDAVERSYPLIHPDWVFSRILGDSLVKIAEEERRLFYVALTRAVERLVIITEKGSASPFMDDIQRQRKMLTINWKNYPPVRGVTSRIVVKVGDPKLKGGAGTYGIRDPLKASGYQWQTTGWKSWAKSFPAEGFNIEVVKGEIWAGAANGVEVRIFDDFDVLTDRYLVDSGEWSPSSD